MRVHASVSGAQPTYRFAPTPLNSLLKTVGALCSNLFTITYAKTDRLQTRISRIVVLRIQFYKIGRSYNHTLAGLYAGHCNFDSSSNIRLNCQNIQTLSCSTDQGNEFTLLDGGGVGQVYPGSTSELQPMPVQTPVWSIPSSDSTSSSVIENSSLPQFHIATYER